MIDADLLLRFVVALALVLALIAGVAWLGRRYMTGGRIAGRGGRRRLAVLEAVALDGRTRLVLVRRDETEHLLVLGPTGAVLVEAGIAAPGGFARAVEAASATQTST